MNGQRVHEAKETEQRGKWSEWNRRSGSCFHQRQRCCRNLHKWCKVVWCEKEGIQWVGVLGRRSACRCRLLWLWGLRRLPGCYGWCWRSSHCTWRLAHKLQETQVQHSLYQSSQPRPEPWHFHYCQRSLEGRLNHPGERKYTVYEI